MSRIFAVAAFFILLLHGCHKKIQPDLKPPRQHVETSQELEAIMHKFDNLIFQQFQSELERDEKRLIYTQEMALLLDDLIANTKKLENYSAQHSLEYIQFANALEQETQNLKTNIAHYQTEKIAPTLKTIKNICHQCHATLQ